MIALNSPIFKIGEFFLTVIALLHLGTEKNQGINQTTPALQKPIPAMVLLLFQNIEITCVLKLLWK